RSVMMNAEDEEAPDAVDEGEGEAEGATAVAEAEKEPFKMSLKVDIENAGPCKKHVRITISRSDIDHVSNEVVKDYVANAPVPGFRAGHVPRKLIEKRFKKEVDEQVRQKVLMQSLQQMGEDHKLDAINEPDLDVESLEIPEAGDFSYEFDVEVRPEFDLP